MQRISIAQADNSFVLRVYDDEFGDYIDVKLTNEELTKLRRRIELVEAEDVDSFVMEVN